MLQHLVDRNPRVPSDQLVGQLVPPAMFDDVSFASYIPAPEEPSQAEAVAACEEFAEQLGKGGGKAKGRLGLFGRRGKSGKKATGSGIYLDGGFGVGKTHLLASIYHAAPEPKAFGTFVELTHVVGALGFNNAVERLSEHSVLCIDEFELDDPGDTMLISRLLKELSDQGVSVAATSNTLPGQLGEGRFAAQDFLREIRAVSEIFRTVRVDGPDYRHRDLPPAPDPVSSEELRRMADAAGDTASFDVFDELCDHLAKLHPSRYKKLVEGLSAVFIEDVHAARDQAVALRLVVFADRLYDASVPVIVSGAKLDEIFTPEMLAGGYKKKYQRAVSRLLALSRFSVASAG